MSRSISVVMSALYSCQRRNRRTTCEEESRDYCSFAQNNLFVRLHFILSVTDSSFWEKSSL